MLEDGALTTATATNDGSDLALLHMRIEIFQHGDALIAFSKRFFQVADFYHQVTKKNKDVNTRSAMITKIIDTTTAVRVFCPTISAPPSMMKAI